MQEPKSSKESGKKSGKDDGTNPSSSNASSSNPSSSNTSSSKTKETKKPKRKRLTPEEIENIKEQEAFEATAVKSEIKTEAADVDIAKVRAGNMFNIAL